MNLEKNKYLNKSITQLFDKKGNLGTDQRGILEIEKLFYQELYAKKVCDNGTTDPFSFVDTGQLHQMHKDLLDANITIE